MNRYENGKIYFITDIAYTKYYYGSTTEPLKKRLERHRRYYEQYLNSTYHFTSSFYLFNEFGIDNCKIELVENYPCKNKFELEAREGYYQRNNACVNKNIAGRTRQEYLEDRKDEIKAQGKKYIENNSERIKENRKQHNEKNKEYELQRNKDYYERTGYYENNKERICSNSKARYENNKDEILAKRKVKYTCQCGAVLRNDGKIDHEKSKKHKKWLEQQEG